MVTPAGRIESRLVPGLPNIAELLAHPRGSSDGGRPVELPLVRVAGGE
jgi:hypothetical protein